MLEPLAYPVECSSSVIRLRDVHGHPFRLASAYFKMRSFALAALTWPVAAQLPGVGTPGLPMPTLAVDQTVDERLQADSQRISGVAMRLLEVQSNIEKVEQEVQGKVFDMETLRSFLTAHKSISQENSELMARIPAATTQVSQLSTQLNQINMNEQARDLSNHRIIEQLKAALNAARAQFPGFAPSAAPAYMPMAPVMPSQQLMPPPPLMPAQPLQQPIQPVAPFAPAPAFPAPEIIEQSNQKIQKADGDMAASDTTTANQQIANAKALQASRAEFDRKRQITMALEQELKRQHTYSENCHGSAEKLRLQLEAEKAKIDAERNAVLAVQDSAKKEQEAEYQTNFLMKTRMRKSRANLATIQSQILVTKERTDALSAEGQEQLGKMREALGKIRTQHDAVESELNVRLQARRELEMAVAKVQAQVEELQKLLVSGALANLRRNNTRLKDSLVIVHGALMQSEVGLMYTQSNITESNHTLNMLTATAEASAAAARAAAKAALNAVTHAKTADDEAQAKAEAATMQAEAEQLTDCEGIWIEEHAEVLAELKQCEIVESDLKVGKAMLAALTSTVQASHSQ